MNVMDITKRIYTNDVFTAAYLMDEKAVNEVEASFQELWDAGAGFTSSTLFTGRQDDGEEQQAACAQQLQAKLEGIVKRAWVSQYTRDEIVSMLSLLSRGPQGRYTKVNAAAVLEMDLDDIALEWSDAHPKQEKVGVPCPNDYAM